MFVYINFLLHWYHFLVRQKLMNNTKYNDKQIVFIFIYLFVYIFLFLPCPEIQKGKV